MAKILILGGGFAAIAAAQTLVTASAEGHEIVLVAKSCDFVFYPALVPMVFGNFRPTEITFDIRNELRERNIGFVEGEVCGIDLDRREIVVRSDDGETLISFDYLLLALGRRLATESVPGLTDHAHHLLSLKSASRFRDAIESFDTGSIVVGLCPGGTLPVPICESALALARRFQDRIAEGVVTVTAVFPRTLEHAFAGSTLFRDVEAEFDRAGVRILSDFPIARVTESRVESAFGSSIRHSLLMLIPAFAAIDRPHGESILGADGFVEVNERMQIVGHPGAYAAGDIVSLPGPRFGYMAMRQGKIAATNILAELRGDAAETSYEHRLEWVLGERFTDPVYFHYGFWDDTLRDYDDDALFGMARAIRERYGHVTLPPDYDLATT